MMEAKIGLMWTMSQRKLAASTSQKMQGNRLSSGVSGRNAAQLIHFRLLSSTAYAA
jgi:hypothetical protein